MKTIYSQSQDFQLAVQTYKQLGNDSNRAALEGCMLLARINNKLLEEFDGNVQSKGYIGEVRHMIRTLSIKKRQAQFKSQYNFICNCNKCIKNE